MASDYDVRLLESGKARKQRLDDAFVFGSNDVERTYRSATQRLLYSMLIAALIAAICVGFSFIQNLLAERERERTSPAALPVSLTHVYPADSLLGVPRLPA